MYVVHPDMCSCQTNKACQISLTDCSLQAAMRSICARLSSGCPSFPTAKEALATGDGHDSWEELSQKNKGKIHEKSQKSMNYPRLFAKFRENQ